MVQPFKTHHVSAENACFAQNREKSKQKSPDVCLGFLFCVRCCKTLFVQGFDRLTIAQSNVPPKVNSNNTCNIKSATKKNLEVSQGSFLFVNLQLLSTLFLFTAVHKIECFAWCIDCVQDVALVFGANNNVSVYALTFAFGSNVFAVL